MSDRSGSGSSGLVSVAGPAGGVTARAVLIALALLVVIAFGAFYVEVLWWRVRNFASHVPAMAPLVLTMLLTAAMRLPGVRRIGLSRREILTIYVIMLIGGPLVSHGVLCWIIPKIVFYYFTSDRNPLWQTTFLQYLPTWFGPSAQSVVLPFFEGGAAVPWRPWLVPMAAWGSFAFALFLANYCFLVLVRTQWIINERLTFPFAHIPLEMVRESGPASRPRLPLAGVFWAGFVFSFALNLLSGLSSRFPAIPAIPLGPTPLMQWQRVGPLAGLGEIDLVLWPWMIAIAYLVPKELSFSCWFFWLVRVGLTVAAIGAGISPPRLPEDWYDSAFPAPYYQGAGATLALGLWLLWAARRHLAHTVRVAVGRERALPAPSAPLSYRVAWVGFVLSVAWLVAFCHLAGCRLLFAFALIGLILGYHLLWARVQAESGLGFVLFPFEIASVMLGPLGSATYTPREITMLYSTRWSYFPGAGDTYEIFAMNTSDAFKVADAAGLNGSRLSPAIVAGFLLSLVVGMWLVLSGIYHYGFPGLAVGHNVDWPASQLVFDGESIYQAIANPSQPDVPGAVAMGAGALVAVLLGLLRLRFWWWPLHPTGYLAANTWGMQWFYMPFFVGWLLKVVVVRFGGLRLYRATVPLAIGAILGDVLNRGVWAVVALVTGGAL